MFSTASCISHPLAPWYSRGGGQFNFIKRGLGFTKRGLGVGNQPNLEINLATEDQQMVHEFKTGSTSLGQRMGAPET